MNIVLIKYRIAAAYAGHTEIASILIRKGADVRVKCKVSKILL